MSQDETCELMIELLLSFRNSLILENDFQEKPGHTDKILFFQQN
jgi:hypothetical protein